MEFIPCWVFPARSSWTSGCSGSRPQILGCSGFLRLRSSRCRLWQSAVSLTPPSPLHTDCRLAGWCWSVLEQLEVTSSVPSERAAALMGLNSTLTSCFFHLAGQKLLLIGCCLSVSPVIGQTQLHVSAGVVLHLCLSQRPAVTLVVVLPLRIRLCRESPSDQSRTPPAGGPASLHLWRKIQQHRWDMKVTVSLLYFICFLSKIQTSLLSSVISPRSQWFLLSLKEQFTQKKCKLSHLLHADETCLVVHRTVLELHSKTEWSSWLDLNIRSLRAARLLWSQSAEALRSQHFKRCYLCPLGWALTLWAFQISLGSQVFWRLGLCSRNVLSTMKLHLILHQHGSEEILRWDVPLVKISDIKLCIVGTFW